MRRACDVVADLLDRGDRAWVIATDWDGPEAAVFAVLRSLGCVAREPLSHPTPTCPHCGLGTPCPWPGRVICDECRTVLEADNALVWPFRAEAFIAWFAAQAKLSGVPRSVGPGVWQLGTFRADGVPWEVFYRGGAGLTEEVRQRAAAYRNVLVVCGHAAHVGDPTILGRHVLLADVLIDDPVGVRPLVEALVPRGQVRFEVHGGGLWVGSTRLGEVPVSSKEYYLLARLAAEVDHFVPYADLKQFVLREAGSVDQADEATFCQRLKSRIKKLWVPEIDTLVVTSNKGDGYRLRGHGGP